MQLIWLISAREGRVLIKILGDWEINVEKVKLIFEESMTKDTLGTKLMIALLLRLHSQMYQN